MSVLDSVIDTRHGEQSPSGLRPFVALQLIWMASLLGLLGLLGAFTVERYYVLSYFGLVVFAHLFAPIESNPPWWRRTKWLVRLGFLGLCYFIATRANDIIQL